MHFLWIDIFTGKGCCVLLKVTWHEDGANIVLAVRQKGLKDFVNIAEMENLTKKSEF